MVVLACFLELLDFRDSVSLMCNYCLRLVISPQVLQWSGKLSLHEVKLLRLSGWQLDQCLDWIIRYARRIADANTIIICSLVNLPAEGTRKCFEVSVLMPFSYHLISEFAARSQVQGHLEHILFAVLPLSSASF